MKGTAFERIIQQTLDRAEGVNTLGARTEYQMDPVGFAKDILNVNPKTLVWSRMAPATYDRHNWDGTVDPFGAGFDALVEWKDVGMESGTATGKTFWCAVTLLWFLGSFEDSLVVTMAPKSDQLRANLWKEIDRLWPYFQAHFPDAWLGDLMIRMRPNQPKLWTAYGFPVGVGAEEEMAQKAKGFHGRDMLFIFEEAPGIPLPVYTSIEETCRSPHNLRVAVGNPTSMGDALHQFCEDPNVVDIRISCLDHPNVVVGDADCIPGAVSFESIQKTERKYGSTGRIYLTQVRGISPPEDKDSLIRMEWCRAASDRSEQERELLAGKSRKALGVDVANSPKGDRAVIARGAGAVLEEIRARHMTDRYNASNLAEEVAGLMESYRIEPQAVGVDSVGVGVSTVNKLKELGYTVNGLNGGSKAPPLPGEETFYNLRAAMYWKLREDLRMGRIALPDNQELFNELTLIRWVAHNKAIKVEEKKDVKKRLGGASPDLADAVVYWNWARDYSGFISGLSANVTF